MAMITKQQGAHNFCHNFMPVIVADNNLTSTQLAIWWPQIHSNTQQWSQYGHLKCFQLHVML